ncbi:MAG: hypothetical protein E6Q40_04475 [Cupriavidus sp.]|nr:MAG: hypothetical protein E6Q40_04475 [Cupriavidus sp.]
MADVDITRRGVLGAMGALPALSFSTVSAASARSDWDAVCAAFAAADKAMQAYDRDYLTPAADRYSAWRDQWPKGATTSDNPSMMEGYIAESAIFDPIQKRFDDLVSTRYDLMWAMVGHPAPDMRAVAHKIEVLIEEEAWEFDAFDSVMPSLLSDLCRLGAN